MKRSLPGAELTLINYGNKPPEIPWGRVRSLLRERVTGRFGMMRWLKDFDLVWDTRSGDSFADIYGLARHRTMSMLHEFAVQAGPRVVLAPQTIGPFRTREGRMLAKRNLQRSTLVFARDSLSARAAERLGRPVDATASDLVFGIDQPIPAAQHDVLLNVSGLLWSQNPHVDNMQYRATVRTIIDNLLERGRAVTLLPHVLESSNHDNDVPVSRSLVQEYDGRVSLHVPEDLDDVRSVIASAHLVIGARMHACLNALSVGTPAVAMAYSRKFAPLLESIGWNAVVSLTETGAHAEEVLAHIDGPDLAQRAVLARDAGQDLLDPIGQHLATCG
ncbi:polysaccharide pyruvyl transferase family protein [Ruania albidiflava]|uniref:polysaccharide pyruvyl transferase family protein n=1 Tax=Ruania albidiflava TaxID=366586 RepID=UPI001FE0F6CD|nr:polysaccharide pyruvyl transferase family protein [Ruania albidiflava]